MLGSRSRKPFLQIKIYHYTPGTGTCTQLLRVVVITFFTGSSHRIWFLILVYTFLAHQHKAAGRKTRLDIRNYGCNGNLLCDHGVVESGDTSANLLCELNGHLMPCTSCLYGKWVEDVCTGQFGVFVYLLCCLVGCCTFFSCCAANVGLSKCVWYWHGPIWAFVVIPHQADWLFNCWHLSSLDCSPQDVIQMTVTLLSGSTSAAG